MAEVKFSNWDLCRLALGEHTVLVYGDLDGLIEAETRGEIVCREVIGLMFIGVPELGVCVPRLECLVNLCLSSSTFMSWSRNSSTWRSTASLLPLLELARISRTDKFRRLKAA
eukprot:CAMPEP_0204907832 /NCGR_PEP_ID=MMETSP1397-20131031/6899_1 /ASSEMBLY_ACC=CAM_ASM_000891 /TAXON_ID=49980 /ORGANISM="Climacostomum Climacostomum virens, Strain Stock W-24" /LENGTH=112 /DNA_ID=CAMNT_0052077117 /DNA_START=502 /DNA_END=840 /DNA_ORIENTATION=+